MFSLKSPHRGNSNENTQYTIFSIRMKIPKLSQICSYWIFSKGFKDEFETVVVNELSVFEPLKFYLGKESVHYIISHDSNVFHCARYIPL